VLENLKFYRGGLWAPVVYAEEGARSTTYTIQGDNARRDIVSRGL
jgi:hypothetical protein